MAARKVDEATGNLVCPRCKGWVKEGARCRRCANRKREAHEAELREQCRAEQEAERERLVELAAAARKRALAVYVKRYLRNSRRYREGDPEALPPPVWSERNPLELPRNQWA